MCAIAGWIGPGVDALDLAGCLESMARRGPDQGGMWRGEDAALLHRRLTVVDPENGGQPMELTYRGVHYILVYNGELYNTEELRGELAEVGHRFLGHSDTEVLLHAYAEWGDACVDRLNGIFAFAVWEPHSRRLFLARDRVGVKPLFYRLFDGGICFASEIKTLMRMPGAQAALDREGLMELMLLGPGRTPGTGVFRGIRELKRAYCAAFLDGRMSTREYWRLEDRVQEMSFGQTVEAVRALLTDAITRQLVSDVPLGCFLSGGLDSSIICAVAAQAMAGRGEKLKTFSVTYRDNLKYFQPGKFQPNSDDSFIGTMQAHLDSDHHTFILDTEELADALYDAVDARDLPGMADVDSSLLLFSRHVKHYATVCLSGECADEIFGGYPWYRDPAIRERAGFPWAQSTGYRAGFVREGLLGSADPSEFVHEKYLATVRAADARGGLDPLERRMREMTKLNFDWFMQTLLDRKDRMGMYEGLELRVPFCDYRLMEVLYSVPWRFKEFGGCEKGLLRHAMGDLLPESIAWRKKSPYPKTHNPAYLSRVSVRMRDLLAQKAAPLWQIVRPDAVERLLSSDRAEPWYGQLMTTPQTIAYLLQVNYWLIKYRVQLEL